MYTATCFADGKNEARNKDYLRWANCHAVMKEDDTGLDKILDNWCSALYN